jgi:mRNA interferase YafQ
VLSFRTTKQFERDYKLIVSQGKDLTKLKWKMTKLVNEETLESRHHDHPLTGNWKGHRDCHIAPDWLLIYKVDRDAEEIIFIRTGTHSALFG